MPAISVGKVLVTGANGFIAAWTVNAFLDAGFAVRGTVRSVAKAEHLKKTFGSYGDKFEYIVVPNIEEDGAFDEAVQGIDAVVHTATPVNLTAQDPAELIDPSLKGTMTLLRAAAGQRSVKRVVYLSSCATVIGDVPSEPRTYDETSWNEDDILEVQEKGRNAHQLAKYRASKIFAEKRAWEFYEENKVSLSWDLAVVNPPLVIGPVHHHVGEGIESLNASNQLLFAALTKGEYTIVPHWWIDARDLAHSLVLSATNPAAAGQRLLVAAGPYKWEDFAAAACKISTKTVPPPSSYDPMNVVYNPTCNNVKTNKLLGMVYRYSKEDTVRDVLQEWESHGWL
ncbi:hypothetical protein BN946_scf184851.g8 [Trametes cinnabarina]|uniref:NAD-dependent epimerase/dehydratase domain-containing protein n=1 Tax=Pycnoporus cinnabarinus TaxID=5643 RepID=A0A060S5J1_PYCCI|nr:hypothetical protein BN946_scf184851.g8 [Trametes cinnabarina]